MEDNNANIEEVWKPFRNVIRNTDLLDSLGVVRAYSVYRHMGSSYSMPNDIQVDPSFYNDWRVLPPWELETLAREILIISSKQHSPRKSLKRWRDLTSAMNKMKEIENKIAELYIDQENVYNEVTVRLTNRQFRYQTDSPSNEAIVRYYRLYSYPKVANLVGKTVGLNPLKIIRIAAGLWANYLKFLGMYYPLERLELSGISQSDYDNFMSLFSKDMNDLQNLMRNSPHRRLDDTFLYAFHELQQYPILFTDMNGRPAHICPQPTLLFWRITTGIYYDMVNIKGFDQAFGESFEKYIGDVSDAILNDSSMSIYGEEENSGPNRCDWIIDNNDSFLLVECKTKRLTLAAKTSLSSDDALEEQIDILAGAVVQAYKSLEAYRSGAFKAPKYSFNPGKQPYIAIVTLEKWYLMGVHLRNLKDKVIKLLDSDMLNGEQLTTEVPFIVLSTTEYEKFLFVVGKKGLCDVIDPSLGGDKFDGWEFAAYMEKTFKSDLEEFEYPFIGELNDIFKPEEIGNV